jgi:L-methionine (R)-S-oxide reductase
MAANKLNRYKRILLQLNQLFQYNEETLSRMATITALLYHKMEGFFWVGFYLLKNDQLLVGPYQGPLACMELDKNKGVCWKAVISGQPVLVPDVTKFPGHIACDSRSKSEIAIPVKNKRSLVIGVLDIDSKDLNNFDIVDIEQLQIMVNLLER